MERIIENLRNYLNKDEDYIHKWNELEQLLVSVGGRKLSAQELPFAMFLVLQADTHIISSCYNKAYDLAGDLRKNIENKAQNVIKFLPDNISKALSIEIQKHRHSSNENSDIKEKSEFGVVAKRDWNFCVFRNNDKFELFAFNHFAPEVVLKEQLSKFEVSLAQRESYYPLCHDIAESLRFNYWLENHSIAPNKAIKNRTRNSWLRSLRSQF
ncbi:hypothetical protein [Vibrio genomosp. F10]|uniref:hypothetical protein n=1 Tax=Vibrio genomosp. F10 TaxID=723171 RepID=UPI0002E7E1A6|nr:hypothetical protein [Vibrio genomosp. F10]OEF06846.1 hypothetical protein A1QI_18340 [Vibrio genomosp. F10 str. 9ZB36]